MYSKPLDIILLDNENLMAVPLSVMLLNDFRSKISIITVSDWDKCMLTIQEKVIVFVLSYPVAENQKASDGSIRFYNALKLRFPENEIVLITSVYDISVATEKMYEEISSYLKKVEQDTIKSLINRTAVHPLKLKLMYPIQRIFREFSINKFVLIFFIAFVSVGLVVFFGTWIWNNFLNTMGF